MTERSQSDQWEPQGWQSEPRQQPDAASTEQQHRLVEAAYRREHERLWRSLYAFTGDPDVASDAAAETVSQALRHRSELRDPAAWMWRTAFKVASGMLAGRSRHLQLVPSEDGGSLEGEVAVDSGSMVEFLDLLKTLSDQQRAIVILRYAGGFTAVDIAGLLGTSPNTVRVQLHRAQAHLRERIDLR